jgi:hypothetical protein
VLAVYSDYPIDASVTLRFSAVIFYLHVFIFNLLLGVTIKGTKYHSLMH